MDVQTGLDAAGFNGHGEKPGVLEAYHQNNPGKPIVLTEEPHLYSTRGLYRTRLQSHGSLSNS